MKFLRLLLLAFACLPARAEEPPLTILAASSLTEVLTGISALYEQQTGEPVRLSFDGSGVLARQIENGAPADLYISAGTNWMDSLARQQLLDTATRVTIAGNQLLLVQPAPHDVFVQEPADLLRLTRIALGDPDTVPAGFYARHYLERNGLWTQLQDRLVFTPNVRAALALVERDEVGAAFVFATDARTVTSEPGLRTALTVDAAQHDRIAYEAAVLEAAPRRVAALKFLWVLETPEAKALFAKFGFTAP